MANLTQRRFKGRDVGLVADAIGDKRNQPVLFLHGGGQTRWSWGHALGAVASQGFYGLALDLRGHGDSDWARDGDYTLDAHCADLLLVLEQIELRPFVIGASLGGLIGLLLGGEHPEMIRGLALIDIVPRFASKGADRIAQFMTSRPNGFASIDEAAADVAAYLPHRPKPPDNSGLLRNLRLRENGRYYWHWDPKTMSQENMPNPLIAVPRLENAARHLKAPTLVVRGGRSDVVDKEAVEAFLSLAPHAKFADVAGAEHMVAGDDNDAFNQVVLEFLNEHRSDAIV